MKDKQRMSREETISKAQRQLAGLDESDFGAAMDVVFDLAPALMEEAEGGETRIDKARAVEIASGWSSGDSHLYRFASLGGRVIDEAHREGLLEEIKNDLHWIYANRQNIAFESPSKLSEFAKLVRLEQFIISAELEP